MPWMSANRTNVPALLFAKQLWHCHGFDKRTPGDGASRVLLNFSRKDDIIIFTPTR